MVVPLGPGKFYGSSLPRPRIYTDVKLNSERVDPPAPVLDPFLSWAHEAHWSMGGLNFKRTRLQGRIEGSIKKLRAESERIIRNKKRSDSKDSTMRDAHKSDGGNNSGKRAASVSPPPAPISRKRRRYMALIDDEEEEEEEEVGQKEAAGGGDMGIGVGVRRMPARKLGDDFDRVASENVKKQNGMARGSSENLGKTVMSPKETVASRTRSRRSEKEDEDEDGIDGVVLKVVEEVKRSSTKSKKLKVGNKREKGLSPSGGIRTSPRLSTRGSR
ncbi:hypothetical protein L1049_024775 [Liquidambar formosana]|uniref:Uncharacterized protein n=1 Tax=Liquidambar formosana TaxID=63359 RepID=A0AAP0X5D6_LIQFO